MTTWLELLLQNASAEEIEAHRACQAATKEGALVEAEARRALQLQALLHERAQRAAELKALSDMAARLTAVRDLRELLTDVARLARQLLRSDVAYLALVEDQSLRIRYFDGHRAPEFRDIELSMSAGLAGRIVETGHPAWTEDYLSDNSFQHAAVADDLAARERLRGILGVPLHAQGSTFGVLFAAERSKRPFADHEIGLLAGLAGHAAVAIENARLFEAERRATEEAQRSSEELRQYAGSVARAIALHERLTEAVVSGGGPAQVVRALSDVLGASVQLVDEADAPMVGPDLGAPPPSEHFAAGARRTFVVGDDGGPLVLSPVVAGDEYLGCIVVRGPRPPDDAELRLVERGALGIALSLVQQRAVDDAALRSQGDLLAALIEGGESDLLQRRAASLRVDLRRPHIVVVMEPEGPGARGACAELARRAGGLWVERAGRFVLLLPAGTQTASLTPVSTAGVSEPVIGAAAVLDAFGTARRCLNALIALGRRKTVGDASALGLYRFLLAPGAPGEAAALVQETVGGLLAHDAAKGTDLARTLEEYLASGRHHTETAERLHIHPNTLYQRLNRITAVLGDHWRTPDRALDVLVALRLQRLAAHLDLRAVQG